VVNEEPAAKAPVIEGPATVEESVDPGTVEDGSFGTVVDLGSDLPVLIEQ
jgi:hypothetical protein